MYSKSRKGSMQLSIEAIIILVIAFVLLGLGIMFVKNFFAQADASATSTIKQVSSPCNTASDSQPITPTEFQVSKGGSKSVQMCVWNNADRMVTDGLVQIESSATDATKINCYNQAGDAMSKDAIKLVSGPLTINRGESKEYKNTIIVGDLPLGTYICNVYVQQKYTGTPTPLPPKVGPIQITVEVV